MKKNFNVGQSNELLMAGKIYDIHNNYAFSSLLVMKNFTELSFEPDREWGAGEPLITITFYRVKHFTLSDKFAVSDISHFEEVGYKGPDDQNLDFISGEQHADETSHLLFRFGSDQVIRIWAERALLSECQRGSARLGS